MEISNFIIELISNNLFPIAACAALFWKLNKSDTDHREEVDKLSSVIQNNTTVITRLVERMEIENERN